eukprot:IDg3364t1
MLYCGGIHHTPLRSSSHKRLVAAFGDTRKLHDDTARNINANLSVAQKMMWKTVRDPYKRLQKAFDRKDNHCLELHDRQHVAKVGIVSCDNATCRDHQRDWFARELLCGTRE